MTFISLPICLNMFSPEFQQGTDGKMFLRGKDGELTQVEVVSTKEHVSIFEQASPTLPIGLAFFCATLNIIPGAF